MILRAEKLCNIKSDVDEGNVKKSKENVKRGEMAGMIYNLLSRAKLLEN